MGRGWVRRSVRRERGPTPLIKEDFQHLRGSGDAYPQRNAWVKVRYVR
jgi:hypothetical protein